MVAGKTTKALAEPSKKADKPALVAPDGGWGWLVVTAFALNFVSTLQTSKKRSDSLEIGGKGIPNSVVGAI